MKRILIFLIAIVSISSCKEKPQIYDLPMAKDIQVDGNAEDWKNNGLQIPIMADAYGNISNKSFSSKTMMSWDKEYLYFFFDVKDDKLFQSKNAPIWKNDGIEIFISSNLGTNEMIQYLIAPSISNELSEAQVSKQDYRSGLSTNDCKELKIFSKQIAEGYCAEIRIPFSALNLKPLLGDSIAVNFYINDADDDKTVTKYSWHYNDNTYNNHDALYNLKLIGDNQIQSFQTRAWLEDTTWFHIVVVTDKKPSMNQLTLVCDKNIITTSDFKRKGEVYRSDFIFKKSKYKDNQALHVFANNQLITTVEWLDMPVLYVKTKKPNSFEPEIREFEKQDSKHFPAPGQVLFIGSSSIRLWKSLQDDFKGTPIINRGFGGSKTSDVLYFFDRIVKPYNPKLIVYYAGTNDLASGELPQNVANNTELFIKKVEEKLPATKVIILSNTMAVARKHLKKQFLETNELLKKLIKNHSNSMYVDVSKVILDKNGKPKPEMFVSDSIHLNSEGYKVWSEVLYPVINKK